MNYKYRIFLDTNVLLDYILRRDPWFDDMRRILNLCANGILEGYAAPHSLTDISFITRKTYTNAERRKILKTLMQFITIVKEDHHTMEDAVENSLFSDLEDAAVHACAVMAGADVILTRNGKDFVNSSVPYMEPSEFLKILDGAAFEQNQI